MTAVINSLATTTGSSMTTFKPPQHKHAHHLHSIPPREKSTRTLILDHMLWLHSKARFGQVSVELNLDGEKSVPAAKALKARADGLEKMLSAMLSQPPEEVEAWDAEDPLSQDTALHIPTSPSSPSILPNGIRLRIALARLMNDLYAQDAVFDQSVSTSATASTSVTTDPYPPALPSYASLSPALSALSRISSFAQYHPKESHAHLSQLPKLPSFHTFTATASGSEAPPAHSLLPLPPAGSIFSAIPRGAGPQAAWALGSARSSGAGSSGGSTFPPSSLFGNGNAGGSSNGGTTLIHPPAPPRVFRAVGRSKELYNAGVTTRTATSPTRQQGSTSNNTTAHGRCPHHLTFTCQPSSFCSHVAPPSAEGGNTIIQKRVRSNIGSGLSRAGTPLRKRTNGDGIASMTELIPRFLRLSAAVAMELGREARDAAVLAEREGKGSSTRGVDTDDEGDTSPTATISGRKRKRHHKSSSISSAALPTSQWYAVLVSLLTRATLQGYLQKGWRGSDPVEILLGVGVGLKTPPSPSSSDDESDDSEGKQFLPDEWPVSLADAWKVLFSSGFNPQSDKGKAPYRGYGQDGSSSGTPRKKPAYAEYERIMADRITDFLTLPQHDLATYLDFFSRNKYTQDGADKEALRFFEAVASWRGEPELEILKRQSNPASPSVSTSAPPSTANGSSSAASANDATSPSGAPSAPSPTTPLQQSNIFQYFTLPSPSSLLKSHRRSSSASSASSSSTGSQKRKAADPDDELESAGQSNAKKVAVSSSSSNSLAPAWGHGRTWMEEDEWVGPYGI
ncbi:hypothetical protein FRB94_012319 [Tulasnella sp. JGI-2019a]|nr:hypothetical protein FRB94_012319 [Tulasnella sp. JGI-2019a]